MRGDRPARSRAPTTHHCTRGGADRRAELPPAAGRPLLVVDRKLGRGLDWGRFQRAVGSGRRARSRQGAAAASLSVPGMEGGECITVTFEHERLGLNFTPSKWPAIESIDADSPAAATEVRAGMCLIGVQGNDMVGKSLEEAGQAFRAAGRPLRLTFQAPVPSRQDEARVLADAAAAQTAASVAAAATAVSTSASSWMSAVSRRAEEAKAAAEELYAKNLQERERRAQQAEAAAEAERRAAAAEAAAVATTIAIKTSEGAVDLDVGSPPLVDRQGNTGVQSATGTAAPATLEPQPYTKGPSAAEEAEPPQEAQEVLELKRQLADQKAHLEAAIAEKQSRIDLLQAAAISAAADEQKAKAQLEESWRAESGANEKIRDLEQELERQKAALADKTEEATSLSSALENVKQTLEAARADVDLSAAKKKENMSAMTRQAKLIAKQEKAVDGLTRKLEEKSVEASEFSRKLEDQERALHLAHEQHSTTQSEKSALEEQVHQLEVTQADLKQQLQAKMEAVQAVEADIRGLLDKSKIDQESLREHCQHVDGLRTKLIEAKISTLLKADDARQLDAEDVYQKSCTKLKALRCVDAKCNNQSAAHLCETLCHGIR